MPIIIPSPRTGKEPQIHESVFIAPTATIIGDVSIGEGSNIWFGMRDMGWLCLSCYDKTHYYHDKVEDKRLFPL